MEQVAEDRARASVARASPRRVRAGRSPLVDRDELLTRSCCTENAWPLAVYPVSTHPVFSSVPSHGTSCGADRWPSGRSRRGASFVEGVRIQSSWVTLPLQDILWMREGITYLRPEVQLLHKAIALRQNDRADFDACAPLLDTHSRAWLRDALGGAHRGHPWISDL
jgi:hypothetical protein